ncbi:MAG: AmmeMemoRadiSam system protein B [Sedimentisphaerales bacterium]|nr:AmmeMemoRadiSam system protein B [Sedimentisphaerales bacterium]
MQLRKPAVAGQFYAADNRTCLKEIKQCIEDRAAPGQLPDTIVAGIVPHAGWMFSGDVAAMVFNAIRTVHRQVDTFIIFGAAHYPCGSNAAVYGKGIWQTPLGEIAIDEKVAATIVASCPCAKQNQEAHRFEHSIEVQVPFVQYLFPEAKIVPIMVPPMECAVEFGDEVGEVIISKLNGGKKIVCIGSTDLTHYGPRYGFDPMGTGDAAIKWAKEVNDRQFIDYALAMNAEKILHTAEKNQNACGAGAAAATIAAAKKLGKTKGLLLAHTNSNEVMQKKFERSSKEGVGYAGIIF